MSRLTPALMPLDKGLNLQAPKILAPEGSALDSLNYEQVDFQGQKRIDGYVRYDGRTLSSFDDFALFSTVTVDANNIAYNDDDVAFGVSVGTYDSMTAVIVFNERELPDDVIWGKDYITDPAVHYTEVLGFAAEMRSYVESLPGGVAGLHWFRDRLYAVADLMVWRVADAVIPVNAELTDGTDPIATVLAVYYVGSSTYLLVDALTAVANFTYDGDVYAVAEVLAGGMASFYESRTEAQVLAEDAPGSEDFGWKFNHQGWAVPFVEGSSLFGSLTSLNQNRQGVGIQGPTSIAGDSGKPLVLTQKVNITNLPAQVNGWKTSTSPNVYNLEADALEDVDSYTIYADAFFSWDGATGEVSAPGVSGEGLIEYPANNTVVVDV